jgi:hypothetical protein
LRTALFLVSLVERLSTSKPSSPAPTALNQISPSLLDRDPVSVAGESVAGDHVSAAGGNDEAGTVSDESVTPHPIAVSSLQADSGPGV